MFVEVIAANEGETNPQIVSRVINRIIIYCVYNEENAPSVLRLADNSQITPKEIHAPYHMIPYNTHI